MTNNKNQELFPFSDERRDPRAKPTYKIIARSKSQQGDSIVALHKSGADHIVNYYIQDLATCEDTLLQMDQKEADLMRWVAQSEITDPLRSQTNLH